MHAKIVHCRAKNKHNCRHNHLSNTNNKQGTVGTKGAASNEGQDKGVSGYEGVVFSSDDPEYTKQGGCGVFVVFNAHEVCGALRVEKEGWRSGVKTVWSLRVRKHNPLVSLATMNGHQQCQRAVF